LLQYFQNIEDKKKDRKIIGQYTPPDGMGAVIQSAGKLVLPRDVPEQNRRVSSGSLLPTMGGGCEIHARMMAGAFA